MSEAKFTKGKWEVNDSLYGGAPLGILATDSDVLICDIHSTDGLKIVTDESIANAYLIAAAPEMYETLKKIRHGDAGYIGVDMYDDIDNVLAKARGEQNA